MKKEIVQTASWLWDLIRNPDVVWVDAETKEEVSRERWKRFGSPSRFHTFRPMWTYYFLTTNPGCGCAKRFGLWHTIWCSKHTFGKYGWDDELSGWEDDEEDQVDD